VITLVATALAQLPFPSTVNVKVTVTSAALAVYVGVIDVAFVMLPAPLCVQAIVPFVAAASVTVKVPLSHMSPVAEVIVAVGAAVTVITFVSTAAEHEPALVTVKVNVTDPPASPAAGV
jgi:hypothetical protein